MHRIKKCKIHVTANAVSQFGMDTKLKINMLFYKCNKYLKLGKSGFYLNWGGMGKYSPEWTDSPCKLQKTAGSENEVDQCISNPRKYDSMYTVHLLKRKMFACNKSSLRVKTLCITKAMLSALYGNKLWSFKYLSKMKNWYCNLYAFKWRQQLLCHFHTLTFQDTCKVWH